MKSSKWLILALVVTLALSLTSCGGRNKNIGSGAAYLNCNDNGNLDIYVQPSSQGSDYFQIVIDPQSLNTENIVAQVALAAESGQNLSSQVISQGTVDSGVQIYSRPINYNELATYTHIVITPAYDGNGTPLSVRQGLEQYRQYSSVCELPFPGDGSAN
jgi:hypothetical protein